MNEIANPTVLGRSHSTSSFNIPAAGPASELLATHYQRAVASIASSVAGKKIEKPSLEERLYDSLAACKIRTAGVAMHFDNTWRRGFFAQLDSLIDIESWDELDAPPTENSFSTLLRTILFIRPLRRPGLGATDDGNFIATWTVECDRLTIECMGDDRVRWFLIRSVDEGQSESAAGETNLLRLAEVLQPYNPQRWFLDAAKKATP